MPAILCAIRETDIAGWHQEHSALEVIFAELGAADKTSTLAALRAKATGILQSVLRPEEISHLRIAFQCFPDEWGQDHTGVPIEKLYPDLVQRDESRKIPRAIKRVTDVLGSAMALILLAPIVFDRRTPVKLSSPGPVLYRQKRIGQYGVPFTCLKFGSMYTGNDPRILYQGTVVRSRARASRRSVFTLRPRVVIDCATLVTVPESHAA